MLTLKNYKHSPLLLFFTFILSFNLVYAKDVEADWRIVGPTGGDVRDLVVSPSDPTRFYLGTLDGQIYTSADSGRSWSLLHNFNRPLLYVDSLLVDPRDSQTIYMGAHRHQAPGGFHKSKDGGKTWREVPELVNESIYSLEQSERTPNMLLAGTNHGIFRSDDSGDTWKALPTAPVLGPDGKPGGLKNVESLAIDPMDDNVIYAGTWYLPYKSIDGGQTWNVVKQGMIEDSDVFAINIEQRNPQHIIASACSGIYESKDGAANWRKINGIPSSSRRTRAIKQHPTIEGLVFAGTTEGFWRSADGGVTWMLITSKTLEINAIVVHPERPDDIYISTNNYGVMLSRDTGKTFQPVNSGYSSRFTFFIKPDVEKPNRFYASTKNTARGGGFFFTSDDGGQTWQTSMRNMASTVDSRAMLQDPKNPNLIYLGTNNGLYRSADRGVTWAAVSGASTTKPKAGATAASASAPPPATASAADSSGARSRRVTVATKKAAPKKPVAKKPVAPKPIFLREGVAALAQTWAADGRVGLLAATGKGLYRTFDPELGGQMITYGAGLDIDTTYVATDAGEPNTIWVGTVRSGVLVSRDSGATWRQIAGIPATSPVTIIKQDPRRLNRIYVGNKQTLYASQDGGETWRRRGGGLPFGEYYAIVINPQNSDEIVAGNAYQNELGGAATIIGGGVYQSFDAGETWQRIDKREDRLPSQRIWALAFDQRSPNRLLVGSHSSGIYVVERKPGLAAANDGNK